MTNVTTRNQNVLLHNGIIVPAGFKYNVQMHLTLSEILGLPDI